MRLKLLLLMIAPILLAACGTTERTVVVTPSPGQTVIVTPAR